MQFPMTLRLIQNGGLHCGAKIVKAWIAIRNARALAFGDCDRVPDNFAERRYCFTEYWPAAAGW